MEFMLSINRNIYNKTLPNAYGWKNSVKTTEELIEHIKNGFAFSPGIIKDHSSSKKPKKDDILAVQLLVLDIDNVVKIYNRETRKYDKFKMSPEEGYLSYQNLQTNDFLLKNALFIYTTPSHTEYWSKVRIIFGLKDIIDPITYQKEIEFLINQFNSDKACSNIDRFFYGNTNAEFTVFNNIYKIN